MWVKTGESKVVSHSKRASIVMRKGKGNRNMPGKGKAKKTANCPNKAGFTNKLPGWVCSKSISRMKATRQQQWRVLHGWSTWQWTRQHQWRFRASWSRVGQARVSLAEQQRSRAAEQHSSSGSSGFSEQIATGLANCNGDKLLKKISFSL
ncbi:hypothetical protein GYH30_042278 [Glycine max]|nr:hypothetical protein GYH30_042278 [Glycine max]